LQHLLQEKVEKLDSKDISKKLHQMKIPCAIVKNIKEVLEQEKAQRLIKTEKTQGEDTSRITSIGFELY
jgi:crotonobetainyl-CoA:carnitine CoA-transferase CaiB-like acyl-CoA transferase